MLPVGTLDGGFGVYGRRPIACEPPERLAALGRARVVVAYGENDWLWAAGARARARDLP